jgi:hypothetical protein
VHRIGFDAIPLLEAVCHSIDIASGVNGDASSLFASEAALGVDFGVVFVARILSYHNENFLAAPPFRAAIRGFAFELAHDIGFVETGKILSVSGLELISQVDVLEFGHQLIVTFWPHGPWRGRLGCHGQDESCVWYENRKRLCYYSELKGQYHRFE